MGIRLDEQEVWEFLDRGHTGIVTTLQRDGWPVSLPVWYAPIGGAVYLRTPRRSAKVARVRNDPRATFLVESGTAWSELKAVVLRCRARVLEPGPEADHADRVLGERYAGLGPPLAAAPAATRSRYSGMVVLRLDLQDDPLTWDNAKLRMRSTDPAIEKGAG